MTMDATLYYLLFVVILPTTGTLCAAANLVSTIYFLMYWDIRLPDTSDRVVVVFRAMFTVHIGLVGITASRDSADIFIFVLTFFIPIILTTMNVRDYRNLWNWRKKN